VPKPINIGFWYYRAGSLLTYPTECFSIEKMDIDSDNRSWYLIYTKPRSEQKAVTHLDEQGFKTYLPRCRIQKMRKSRRIAVTEALFPNYLFIRLDDKLDNWAPIRSTPGVSKLVRFGQMPARVPDIFIDSLKANDDENGLQEIASPSFKHGDKVRLLDGPMAGLEAIYQTAKGSDRAMIMLSVLGNLTRVELKSDGLEHV